MLLHILHAVKAWSCPWLGSAQGVAHQLQVLPRDALEFQEPVDEVGGQVQRLRQQLRGSKQCQPCRLDDQTGIRRAVSQTTHPQYEPDQGDLRDAARLATIGTRRVEMLSRSIKVC